MKKTQFRFLISLVALFVVGCMPANYVPTKTSIELQAFQTKEFEISKKVAYAATLSVFQDLGYIVETGSYETGLISGQSPTIRGHIWGGVTQEFRKGTAFVETVGKGIARIRLNFVDMTISSGESGQSMRVDRPVETPELYQDVFSKVEKAIFVRKNIDEK
jgi:hypothetical protein